MSSGAGVGDAVGADEAAASGEPAGVASATDAALDGGLFGGVAVRAEEPHAATAMATMSVRRIGFRIGAWSSQPRILSNAQPR